MNRLPLKWAILLSVTLTCVLAVIVTTLVTVRAGLNQTEQTILDDTRTLARVLGESNLGAITFDDRATVTDSLAALASSPRVRNAVVYTDGTPFAWYTRGERRETLPSGISRRPLKDGLYKQGNEIVITEPIEDDTGRVGSIAMRLNLSELNSLIKNAVWDAVLLVLVISLIALGVAWVVQLGITRRIRRVVQALRDIAEGEGDLTRRLPVSGRDEIADLAIWFNTFVERLHAIIQSVSDTAREVSDKTQTVSSLSNDNEVAIKDQQAEIEQIVVAIQQMASVVEGVTESVTETADKSAQADQTARSGREVVNQTSQQIEHLAADIESASQTIHQLQSQTESIGTVLDVIRGVAEQTNLLALNAAIEAARAGEQGRGFAVVADEVRTLASRTQSSTTEIQEMIERLQEGAKIAVTKMAEGTRQAGASVEKAGEASKSLEEITALVTVISDHTNQVAAASEEQSQSTHQIADIINNVSQVAEATAESSSEINHHTSGLAERAGHLTSLVKRFQL